MLRKTLSLTLGFMFIGGAAFAAASVRTPAISSATGSSSARAGTLRLGGASVKSGGGTATSVSTSTSSAPRLSSLPSTGIKYNKPTLPLSASASALEALEKRVDELARNYNTLGGQYSDLASELSDTTGIAVINKNDIATLKDNPGVDEDAVNRLIAASPAVTAKADADTVATVSSQVDTLATDLGTLAATVSGLPEYSDLKFLCDNPSFAVSKSGNKSTVKVNCDGVEKGSFDIVDSDTVVCHSPKQEYSDKDAEGCYTITETTYTLENGECVAGTPVIKKICDGHDGQNGQDGQDGEDGEDGQTCVPIFTTEDFSDSVGNGKEVTIRTTCDEVGATPTKYKIYNGADGTPGVGINYKGIVATCEDLDEISGAVEGDAYYCQQDTLLYIHNGMGFPECPNGGVPFKGKPGDPGCTPIVKSQKLTNGVKIVAEGCPGTNVDEDIYAPHVYKDPTTKHIMVQYGSSAAEKLVDIDDIKPCVSFSVVKDNSSNQNPDTTDEYKIICEQE